MKPTIDSYINTALPIEKELTTLFSIEGKLVIFDIGSCEGEDSIKYARLFPNSKIYSVEALPKNLELIRKNISLFGICNVEIIPFALSNQTGISTFHVSSGQPEENTVSQNSNSLSLDWDYGNKSSSLLAPADVQTVFPWLKFDNGIDVETTTLNDICLEKGLTCIDFIHMDVQGAELLVLQGAGDLIRSTKVIWLEVEAVHLYQNQPLRADIEKFMLKNNFWLLKDTVDNISGDQMYVNRNYFPKIITSSRLLLRSFISKLKLSK
jgi:FkbM family methyltransferase